MAVRGSIPKTMKALVAYSKDDYRLELEYRDNEEIIRTLVAHLAGVSLSDPR